MAKTMSGEVQGDERKRTTDEVSKTIRRRQNWGPSTTPGKVQGDPVYCLGGVRHAGGMNLSLALVWNVGTCRPDAKGEIQVEETTRMRVPMRGTGADQLVVVVKSL